MYIMDVCLRGKDENSRMGTMAKSLDQHDVIEIDKKMRQMTGSMFLL